MNDTKSKAPPFRTDRIVNTNLSTEMQNEIAMGFMRPKTLQSYFSMGGIPLSRSAVSELQRRPDFPKAYRLSSTLVLYKVFDIYNWVISHVSEKINRSWE